MLSLILTYSIQSTLKAMFCKNNTEFEIREDSIMHQSVPHQMLKTI